MMRPDEEADVWFALDALFRINHAAKKIKIDDHMAVAALRATIDFYAQKLERWAWKWEPEAQVTVYKPQNPGLRQEQSGGV